MRSISRKAVETMQARRDFYASAEITFADGAEKTLGRSDFTLSGNTVIDSAESSSFPLGILASKRVTLSLMNDDDRWSEYDFYGAKIYLETKYDLDDGTTESFAIGTFTVVTPESYGTVISVTAMDDSYKTDKAYATSLSYPMPLGAALRDSCSSCGITLIGEVPNSDYVIPSAPTDLTHRQFIGMCAMIAGGNAKFDERNRLLIVPYDFSAFEKLNLWDGGSFKPWTEGEEKDGGTFSPWTTGEVADGGTFGDRDNIHVLHEFATGMTLEVDDVVITGVQMEAEDEEGKAKTHLYGSEGYVLSLENQLAKGKEDTALALIGKKIVGLRFRPFSGNHIALPTAEFMDLAMIVDWKQNVYQTVLTDVTFNYFGFTALKCAADSPIRNSSKRYGSETKAIIQARQMVEREKTEREKAVEILADELANSNGLYMTEERQDDGSTVYYMHDKPTKGESKVVWKLTANAFGVSTDGGKSYPYGLDANGMAILDRIYAIGLDADYIKTGAIEISKNGKQMVLMDYDTGQVIIRPDTFELSSGATIESIAEGKAKTAADGALNSAKGYTDTTAQSTLQSANGYADTAASGAVNDFVSKTYSPKIAEMQKQLDGQIESFFYDYQPTLKNIPASNWQTETDRQKHEGDLFYWKSKGYAYRFLKNGNEWTWQLLQDTDITKAIEDASHAQDTADNKRRTFLTQPTPPYDVGDLWYGGTTADVKVCTNSRAGGNYSAGDWSKQDRYIDQAAANTAASSAVNGQTQRDIFNKLTNNGKNSGIYLDGTNLYVNADYVKSGTVDADRIDVDDIFSKNITATGTINGAKIVGGSVTSVVDMQSGIWYPFNSSVEMDNGELGSSSFYFGSVGASFGSSGYDYTGERKLSIGGGGMRITVTETRDDTKQQLSSETLLTITYEGKVDCQEINAATIKEGGTLLSGRYAAKSHTHTEYLSKEDSGWRTSGICKYRKKNGWVEVDVYSSSYNIDTSYTTLMTLPSGYRPTQTLYASGVDASGTVGTVLYVNTSGTVGLKAEKAIGTALAHIVFACD